MFLGQPCKLWFVWSLGRGFGSENYALLEHLGGDIVLLTTYETEEDHWRPHVSHLYIRHTIPRIARSRRCASPCWMRSASTRLLGQKLRYLLHHHGRFTAYRDKDRMDVLSLLWKALLFLFLQKVIQWDSGHILCRVSFFFHIATLFCSSNCEAKPT